MNDEVKEPVQATEAEVKAVVSGEGPGKTVLVGDKTVAVRPLKRGWQSLFLAAALPMFQADIRPAEAILKSLGDGSFFYSNSSEQMIQAEIDADSYLDRAAAVVLASNIIGAENNPEEEIARQITWLRLNTRTEELRNLVEEQQKQERLVQRVGERSPVRFARLLNLAGETSVTADSLKQHLTSLLQNWQALAGSGSLARPESTGSSSDGPKETT